MILLIEPNKKIRRRLCDLLIRERIIAVGSYTDTLEMIAKFRNRINLIVTNIRLFKDILLKGTLFRLCQKLYIEIPPILALFRRGDEKIKEEFEKNQVSCALVKFDSEDTSFPERYIDKARELYPDIIANMKHAHESWLKGDEMQPLPDPHDWLVKQGFLKAIEGSKIGKIAKDMETFMPLIRKIVSTAEPDENSRTENGSLNRDYKEEYHKLKKKYDLLVSYIKQLARQAKASQD
jgi:hypothetical protein